MPKTSKALAPKVEDFGVAEDRSADLDGFTCNFVTIRQGHDLAPILAQLPTGNCQCPHWGFVFKGRLTVRYADHEEVIEAGEAFSMSPGHAPAAKTGSEFVMFSPSDQLAEVEALMKAAMAATPPAGRPE